MLLGICSLDLVSMLKVRRRILWNAAFWLLFPSFLCLASPALPAFLSLASAAARPQSGSELKTLFLPLPSSSLLFLPLTAPSFAGHSLLQSAFNIIFYLEMLFPEKQFVAGSHIYPKALFNRRNLKCH